jgi:NAD(P)-dependent dehydrogenase (short-subunit alcohol dehydrogenase family)
VRSGEGLVALVTGANRGIGFEVARQLGTLGYVPVVASRDRELGTAAVERLAADGVVAECVELDVTDEATVRAAAEPGSTGRVPGDGFLLIC